MKAKVIATGEIVDVVSCGYNHTYNEQMFLDCNQRHMKYFSHELEFIDEHKQHNGTAKHIDWEQRRFELVKEMLPQAAVFSNDSLLEPGNTNTNPWYAAAIALKFADAVIAKLKEEQS